MRKQLIVAMLAFSTPAIAGEYEDARDAAYDDAMVISTIKVNVSTCAILGTQVANIMVNRLNGEAMSKQMSEQHMAFHKFVVRDAYKQPFYQALEMQEKLVRDFRERYEVECYDVLGANG